MPKPSKKGMKADSSWISFALQPLRDQVQVENWVQPPFQLSDEAESRRQAFNRRNDIKWCIQKYFGVVILDYFEDFCSRMNNKPTYGSGDRTS